MNVFHVVNKHTFRYINLSCVVCKIRTLVANDSRGGAETEKESSVDEKRNVSKGTRS